MPGSSDLAATISSKVAYAICPDCGDEFFGSDAASLYNTHMDLEHRPKSDDPSLMSVEEQNVIRDILAVADPNSSQCGMSLQHEEVMILAALFKRCIPGIKQ